MKKIILLILTSILFASNIIVLKKKEKIKKNKVIREEIIFRKWLIDKINAVLPSYLQAEPKENMFKFSIKYDTDTKTFSSNLNIKVFFPSIEGKKSSSTTKKTRIYKFKLLPILQLYKKLPTITLKASFTYNSLTFLRDFYFNETIYYYTTFTEYKEISTITLKRFINISNLEFQASKTYNSTQKNNIFYSFGVYYSSDLYKFIRIYGYTFGGDRKHDPFIYYHKLFFTYRHILFNKRYIYLDITPYILSSKEHHYSPRFNLTTSLNVKF